MPVHGTYLADVLPGLVDFGLGLGAGPAAAVTAALSGVDPQISGVASGAVNAMFQIGGALGVAITSAVVVSRGGASTVPQRMTEAFRAGFTADVFVAAVCLGVTLVLLRPLVRRIRGRG